MNARDSQASSSTGIREVTTHHIESPPVSPEPPDVPMTQLQLRPRPCGCASVASRHPSIVGPIITTAQPLQVGHPQASSEHLIVTEDDEEIYAAVEEWQDSIIEIILDIGACRHVMARESAPGYPVHESPGSRRGQNFIVGNGERVPNEGQMALSLQAEVGEGVTALLGTTFQVADLTRPLMSVSQVCEQGFHCVFESTHALIVDPSGETVCRFDKEGQLFVAKMKLRAPDGFVRPS